MLQDGYSTFPIRLRSLCLLTRTPLKKLRDSLCLDLFPNLLSSNFQEACYRLSQETFSPGSFPLRAPTGSDPIVRFGRRDQEVQTPRIEDGFPLLPINHECLFGSQQGRDHETFRAINLKVSYCF
jgi:hypothetical protein